MTFIKFIAYTKYFISTITACQICNIDSKKSKWNDVQIRKNIKTKIAIKNSQKYNLHQDEKLHLSPKNGV